MIINEKDFYKHLLIEQLFIKTQYEGIDKQLQMIEGQKGELTIHALDDDLKLKLIKRYNGEIVDLKQDYEIIFYNIYAMYMSILNNGNNTKKLIKDIKEMSLGEYFNI